MVKKLSNYEYFKTDLGVLYKGDNLKILPLIKKEINNKNIDNIDLLLTDPPYNASNSKISFADKHYTSINQEWDKNFKAKFLDFILAKQLLIFCSYHSLKLYNEIDNLQQILHWIKKNPVPSISGKTYNYCIEYILWFINDRPYIYNKDNNFRNDYFETTTCSGFERSNHPSQKPLKLIKKLIDIHSNKNDLILDPFIGSGTIAIACEQLGRRWIGIEINNKYCEIAKKRIKKEAEQIKMF